MIILALYVFFLTFVLLYALTQFVLSLHFLNGPKNVENHGNPNFEKEITIQLPVYNERYVVERLLAACLKLNWPTDKLEIQVLDDSTDETSDLIEEIIRKHRKSGITIRHIKRKNRTGFKAGALAEATSMAKGQFIAIFDADFVPEPDFLINAMPYFENEKIGLVQSRWTYLNKGYSMLTRLQAMALDAHFFIEQSGRNTCKHFINFNGTAGIWRKNCILDAGGWQSDTLTEDLDLSYRAQLKGWEFIYLQQLESPSELPVTIEAIRSQQYRWAKGAAECTRKNLGNVLRSHLPLATKWHAFFHLLNSFLYLCINALMFLSLPLMLVIEEHPEWNMAYGLLKLFFVSTLLLAWVYFLAFKQSEEKFFQAIFKFLILFPLFLSLSLGIALYNAFGVIQGYLGIKSAFVRTPKFNLVGANGNWKSKSYFSGKKSRALWFELVTLLYSIIALVVAISINNTNMLIFLSMMCLGFTWVLILFIRQSAQKA